MRQTPPKKPEPIAVIPWRTLISDPRSWMITVTLALLVILGLFDISPRYQMYIGSELFVVCITSFHVQRPKPPTILGHEHSTISSPRHRIEWAKCVWLASLALLAFTNTYILVASGFNSHYIRTAMVSTVLSLVSLAYVWPEVKPVAPPAKKTD